MKDDVRREVRMCGICQTAKYSRKTKMGARQRLFTGRPWSVVAFDFVGPLSRTPRGNAVILVYVDTFIRVSGSHTVDIGYDQGSGTGVRNTRIEPVWYPP